ncbi:MAG: sterol desaturase family protein [Oligoflexus sp.]
MLNPGLIITVLPIFMLLIAGEALLYRQKKWLFPYKEALVSISMFMIYQLANLGFAKLLAPFTNWLYDFRLWTVPLDSWWGLFLLFLGLEFSYYWLHRCAHEIRWIWASHSVHHSPENITLAGAYRLAITGIFSGLFLFFVPLYLLGFSPQAVTLMFAVNLIYQFWLHTELVPKLGFLEKILNTPSHHRVHHSIEEKFLDKNYGGILIIFDRLFGTYAVEKTGETKRYGLLGKEPSLNPIKLFFQEWLAIFHDIRQSRDLRSAFLYCFAAPGWKPKAKQGAEVWQEEVIHRKGMAEVNQR